MSYISLIHLKKIKSLVFNAGIFPSCLVNLIFEYLWIPPVFIGGKLCLSDSKDYLKFLLDFTKWFFDQEKVYLIDFLFVAIQCHTLILWHTHSPSQ